jgi:epoxyqueuosine reductase
MEPLETRLKQQARALGFDLVGVVPATAADGFDHLRDWLARGFAGAMGYVQRHAEARRHPAAILPEVRSVVMVGMNYAPAGGNPRCSRRPRRASYSMSLGFSARRAGSRGK